MTARWFTTWATDTATARVAHADEAAATAHALHVSRTTGVPVAIFEETQ